MTMKWSGSDHSVDIVISGGGLVATMPTGGPSTNEQARATVGVQSGKVYFETKWTVASSMSGVQSGISNASHSVVISHFLGEDANSIGWVGDGRVFYNNAQLATIQTYAVNDTCCIAIDFGLKKIWFRTNAGNWNNAVLASQNPATGVGGFDVTTPVSTAAMATAQFNNNGDSVTANFAGPFAQAVPSGFSAWGPYTVTVTLSDINGALLPNLSNLHWAWWDVIDVNLIAAAPVANGVAGATDANSVITLSIPGTSLLSGQSGMLVMHAADRSRETILFPTLD